MKHAIDIESGKLVDIIESVSTKSYICPICKKPVIRKFGQVNQFYSHPEGESQECELKIKILTDLGGDIALSNEDKKILEEEYYKKSFNDVSIKLSDYKSEEGFYLTEEQKEIIFSTEDRVKVSALAGSAKSSTLYYYCKERPHKKILYLVYNKAMKDEADKTFGKLPHVDVKTLHGLAFGYTGRLYKHKLSLNYGIIDVINDLGLDKDMDLELGVKIDAMMKEYILSDVENFEDIDMFYTLDKFNRKIPAPYRDNVIFHAKKLWELKKDVNSAVMVEHDFYLKLFQLSKPSLSHKYDIICLDEAQDSNMMILNLLLNSKVKGLVIVGDKYQQLYAWRKAVNIMPEFNGKEYKLTTSFRVSQNIANIANIIIRDMTQNEISMRGFNGKQTIVGDINNKNQHVILCRTNSYIFAEVFSVLSKNLSAKLFFEGGYNSYNFRNVRDAFWFSRGCKTNNPLFKKFENYSEMLKYATEVEDLELLALHRMIDNYGDDIPNIIDSIKNNVVTNKEQADVIFSTIHRSKGQTYKMPIYISDDHFDIGDAFQKAYIGEPNEKYSAERLYEEMCILYVAITRCAGQIRLSEKLKQYLLLRHKLFNINNKQISA